MLTLFRVQFFFFVILFLVPLSWCDQFDLFLLQADPKLTLQGDPRRYLAGSLGQGMAGKIVELRAALLVSGAVRLIHPGTERKALIRAMPSSKRGFR